MSFYWRLAFTINLTCPGTAPEYLCRRLTRENTLMYQKFWIFDHEHPFNKFNFKSAKWQTDIILNHIVCTKHEEIGQIKWKTRGHRVNDGAVSSTVY